MRTALLRAMAGLLCTGLSLMASAKQQDGYVDGVVNVQARRLTLVSNEYGDSYFPGQRLSIDVSGTIDVNPEEQWEENCFLGICKRHTWINHHWFDASRLPVIFVLLDESDNKVAEFAAPGGKASYLIPTDVLVSYNRKLRLFGMVSDTTPAIDARRSRGQYAVRISVDTSARIRKLPAYLAAHKPAASELKARWAYDPFLITQNRSAVVAALISFAQSAHPASDRGRSEEHRALLDYAAEIDPTNPTVGSAAADMFIKQGNFKEAEAQMVATIKKLQQLPGSADNPITQTALARAYIKLASTMSAARGYADAGSLSAIAGHYTTAVDIGQRFRAPAVLTEALFGRALLLRSRNTLDALKMAQDDLSLARARSPQPYLGVPDFVSPDAEEMLVNEYPGKVVLASRNLFAAAPQSRRVDIGPDIARVWAVSASGKAYVSNDQHLGVVRLEDGQAAFEQMLPAMADLGSMQTNGTYSILARNTPGGFAPLYLGPSPMPMDYQLLRETPGRVVDVVPILLDAKPVSAAIIAARADRYLAVGAWGTGPAFVPPPFELRQISASGESSTVRRFQIPGLNYLSLCISSDGQRVLGIVMSNPPQPAAQKIVVWDGDGGASEIATVPFPLMVPPAPGAPPPVLNIVASADFTPDGKGVVIVRTNGLIQTAPLAPNPPLLTVARDDQSETSGSLMVSRVQAVGQDNLVVEGFDGAGHFVQLLNTATRQLRMIRKEPEPFNSAAGYWLDAQRGVSIVQMEAAPTTLKAVRIADHKSIGAARIEFADLRENKLLKGGRYICHFGRELGLTDLLDQSYTVVLPAGPPVRAQPPGVPMFGGMPVTEATTCLARGTADNWLMVRHAAGAIISAMEYVGRQPRSAQNVMPPVPSDIVELNTAAATRMKSADLPPKFMLPQFNGPGQLYAQADSQMFSAAYPGAAVAEAFAKNSTGMVSIPYVLLLDAQLSVRRMRLPLTAIAMKILPSPQDKVIYSFKNKVWWKSLHTDAEGKPLFDLPGFLPVFPPVPGDIPLYLAQITSNRDGSRVVFGLHSFNMLEQKIEVEQKVFDVRDTEFKLVPCAPCGRRALNAAKLMPLRSFFPLPWGSVITDSKLERLVVYQNEEQAGVFDLSAQRQIASLPFKNVIHLDRDRAVYLTGPREYSVIEY